MTLVIARKKNNDISLVSDSRLNFGQSGSFDYCIKVSSIPVKIYEPTDEQGDKLVAYEQKIGIAVTGSSTAAYTIKEYMSEVLTNIQYTPGYSDLSLKGIANFVFRFYKKICSELGIVLRKEAICQIIIAGFCPALQKARAFVLSAEVTEREVVYSQEEILVDDADEMEFFGSGTAAALALRTQRPRFSSLNIVREVIRDAKVPTVGGSPQFGQVSKGDFNISGLAESDPTPENPNHSNFVLWGINHDEGDMTEDDLGFLIGVGYMIDVGQIYPDLG